MTETMADWPLQPRVPGIINGIATHGAGNVDLLKPHLRGRFSVEPIDVVLPKRGFVSARRWKVAEFDAKIILQVVRGYSVTHVLAHSFGAPRVLMAAKQHEFEVIVLDRPALRRGFDISQLAGSPTVICVYSPHDIAIHLGALLPFHLFGRAGAKGMTHRGVINVRSSGMHSADFREPKLTFLADLLNDPIPTLAGLSQDGADYLLPDTLVA